MGDMFIEDRNALTLYQEYPRAVAAFAVQQAVQRHAILTLLLKSWRCLQANIAIRRTAVG